MSAAVPLFEFEDAGRHYRIFADGRVEGCAGAGLRFNRLPFILRTAISLANKLGRTELENELRGFE